MTKANSTAIAIIVDESGSMSNVTSDTIGGINTFLAEQKKTPGEATLTLVKFNDTHTTVLDYVDLQTVKELTTEDYRPSGNTALYDAIGVAATTLGKRFSDMPEDQRPSSVVVAILTDGQENSSRQFQQHQVAALIKQQTEVYSWSFLFLAANQDAVLAAGKLNINAGSSMTYASSKVGTRSAFTSMSNSVARGRQLRASGNSAGSDTYQFTDADRQAYADATNVAPAVIPPVQTP
jgi:uncharacterized protein YegL